MTQGFTGINKGMSIPLAVKEGGTGLTSTTINQILYSSSTDTIAGLTTANTGIYTVSPTPVITTNGQIPGTATNDNANSGNIGEYLSVQVLIANRISISINTAVSAFSLGLSAGDWNVHGNMNMVASSNVTVLMQACLSTSINTLEDISLRSIFYLNVPPSWIGPVSFPVPVRRISISQPTTIYMNFYCSGAVTGCFVSGAIYARRVR